MRIKYIPYNGNHPRKKSFANMEAFANVFLQGNSRKFYSADDSRYTVCT